ncbi:hypothetical protein OAP63_10910 [Vibrio sp.]|uniref:Uncharacterized protein n=1 Tax=Vibrio viridaestus TaxID=2487322 RepID=A0A3N9TCU1_9VIBR|nr:hypothetical protein [Vibrio viridaestus]MDC0611239.1 hypothetical protein [Vibrio sp.]RQW61503.1 hypothetical protein EES38_19375 [Vibrio viridaestus]
MALLAKLDIDDKNNTLKEKSTPQASGINPIPKSIHKKPLANGCLDDFLYNKTKKNKLTICLIKLNK